MSATSSTLRIARQSIAFEKRIIRLTALKKRNRIQQQHASVQAETYDKLFRHFHDDIIAPLYGTVVKPAVAGYYPIGSEFDVIPLLQRFYGYNHKIALPVVQEEYDISCESPLVYWEWIPGTQTSNGKFNIPIPIREKTHPLRPDILLVPLLAFDTHGRRLGYGGGFYDRAIEKLRGYNRIYKLPEMIKENWKSVSTHVSTEDLPLIVCGVGFDEQKRTDLVEEAHDQKMDLILTEKNIYLCNENLKQAISKMQVVN